LQIDLDRNFPSSEIAILAINEFGQDAQGGVPNAANLEAANGRDLPLLQDTDADLDGASDVWASTAQALGKTAAQLWRDVLVVDGTGEIRDDQTNLTSDDLAQPSNYNNLRQLIVSIATEGRQQDPTKPWQNAIEPYDVNNDGFVTAVGDVLPLIGWFNTQGLGALPTPTAAVTQYLDVTGNNSALASDAFAIIRHINLSNVTPAANAGGEPEAAEMAAAIRYDEPIHAVEWAMWENTEDEPEPMASVDYALVAESVPQVDASGCPGHVEATDTIFAAALDVEDEDDAEVELLL
jgi:hypothetical protein